MAIFLNDTFTDTVGVAITAHTSDDTGTWSLLAGNATGTLPTPKIFAAFNSSFGATAIGYASYRSSRVPGSADEGITVPFYWDGGAYSAFGIHARQSADGNSGYLAYLNNGSGTASWELYRLDAGVFVGPLSTALSPVLVNGAANNAVFNVTGSGATVALSLSVGGTVITSYNDTAANRVITAGFAGLRWSATAVNTGIFAGSISGSDSISASTVTSVTVAPTTATVAGSGAQTFVATVAGTGTPSTAVTWSTTAGSITSGGVFTAPVATASVQTVTVTATSVQDGTKSGTATVTVPATASTVTTVTISPTTATVAGNASQTFTATVAGTGTPSQSVTWSTNLGSINSSGVYTAPAATGAAQTATVTATSAQDGTKSSTATVTIPLAVVVPGYVGAQYKDLVKDTSSSISAATITLDNASLTGYRTFGTAFAIGTTGISMFFGDTNHGANWMICACTLTSSTTLTVNTILSSSAGGAAPTFTAGVKDVYATVPAALVARKDYIDAADYAIDPTFTTDSTAGFQAAINDALISGIVRVKIPVGHYKIAGPLLTAHGNCQLYVPVSRMGGVKRSVSLEGAAPPCFENQGITTTTVIPIPLNGVILESTIYGSGTHPAVIGSDPGNAADDASWVWNYTNFDMSNICVRTNVTAGANSMCGVNASFIAQGPSLNGCRIDVNMTLPTAPDPTAGSSYGVILPPVNNHTNHHTTVLYISGYCNAISATEHTNIDSLYILGCVNGVVLEQSYHGSWIGHLNIECTANSIVLNGDHGLAIGQYSCEHDIGATYRWYSFLKDILKVAGTRKVTILNCTVVVGNVGTDDTAFTTNTTLANFKIVSGAGAN